MSEPLLAVSGLRVEYDHAPAVHEATLQVEAGEIVALVGANGAGKTSTFRAIAGIVPRAAGRITLNGVDITRMPAHEVTAHGVAHVPEGRRLFGSLTVEENLALGAYQQRDRDKIAERLAELEAMFPIIAARRRQRASTLSGGEQQLVALARGLMSRPRLLLLDEPSLGVMPTVVAELYDLCRRLVDDGMAIMIADQNLERLLGLCDRGYVYSSGRVVLSDTGANLAESDDVRRAFFGTTSANTE